MKIELIIEIRPHSFDTEDEISNVLQDSGNRSDLEVAIKLAIEEMMHWRDIEVKVKAKI